MLLSSPHHSAEKFSPSISSGLRSLLVPPRSGGVVVTRAIAAVSPYCGAGAGVEEKCRHGASIISGDVRNPEAEEEEEEDVMIKAEEDVGCWVSYGRRVPRRRLPPPIPSLLARGALRRTRTEDGRLVIRIAPVVWPECTRARRRAGRLTMQLVEHNDETPLTPPPAPIGGARDDDDARTVGEPDHDTSSSSPAIGEGVDDGTAVSVPATGSEGIDSVEEATKEMLVPVAPPPRVPSAGCFEDVFKYGSIGGTSLHQMPSLRMVH